MKVIEISGGDFLIHYRLKDIKHSSPWGDGDNLLLHWFALTDSYYWFNFNGLEFPKYSDEIKAEFKLICLISIINSLVYFGLFMIFNSHLVTSIERKQLLNRCQYDWNNVRDKIKERVRSN